MKKKWLKPEIQKLSVKSTEQGGDNLQHIDYTWIGEDKHTWARFS